MSGRGQYGAAWPKRRASNTQVRPDDLPQRPAEPPKPDRDARVAGYLKSLLDLPPELGIEADEAVALSMMGCGLSLFVLRNRSDDWIVNAVRDSRDTTLDAAEKFALGIMEQCRQLLLAHGRTEEWIAVAIRGALQTSRAAKRVDPRIVLDSIISVAAAKNGDPV